MAIVMVCAKPDSSGGDGLGQMGMSLSMKGSYLRLQGTCEWMEGVLRPQSSQDISPPKDTTEDALPAQAPMVIKPAARPEVGAALDVASPAPAMQAAAQKIETADHAAPAEVGYPQMAGSML